MDVQSFTINHDELLKGVYVSRKDNVGSEVVTTFDIRMKRPNVEPPIDMPAVHTLEHLMAVYIRSPKSGWTDKLIYVGPMGCRTGMYMVAGGDLEVSDVLTLLIETFEYVRDFDGVVPATISRECGNYLEHNLTLAKWEAKIYLETLNNMEQENMIYPE